jgi:hydrogenase maturation protein HypF
VRGAVQGVGFRPFVFRLATGLALRGWVNNSPQGVFIEAEGSRARLEDFLMRLEAEKPPRSFIQSLEPTWLDPAGFSDFQIRPSDAGGDRTALVLPDIATCPECLAEIFDPKNRRHRYPFTNCTHCGPRFSIIEALPYDRASTSMKRFKMCLKCQVEYEDPLNRRFHAQPNACPMCGPQLELWDRLGELLCPPGSSALDAAAGLLRQGQILAVKGLGGFHLMVCADNDEAVLRLRALKHREEKPFAVMFPSLEAVRAACRVSPLEERLLRSPEAPIVLLARLDAPRLPLSRLLAPGNPNLGVLLPYTPLHHLLLATVGGPVVATSGNLSDEPICIDEREALDRLGAIADAFLVHDRPIVRHVDDSIVRVVAGRELVLRRARGYAPLPVRMRSAECGVRNEEKSALVVGEAGKAESDLKNVVMGSPNCVLAVGAHLKNSVALAVGEQVFLSQHIGDLETDQAFGAFQRVIVDLQKLYEVQPHAIAADLHPDYLSSQFARNLATTTTPLRPVQHHLAHVLSCMAENELAPPVLGVSWDGTGYGPDGTVWGGEFFRIAEGRCERFAHFETFRLPGGDKAVREPRRTALGLLFARFGEAVFEREDLPPVKAFSPAERASLRTMLARGLNAPMTSSAGRLFDAVASLAGLRQQVRFEGQAAMDLEFALGAHPTSEAYAFGLQVTADEPQNPNTAESPSVIEAPAFHSALRIPHSALLTALLEDLQHSVPVPVLSAKFHNGLVEAIIAVARRAGCERVALSGGCFQNRYLLERTCLRLEQEGFRPYWHQRVPPNDGGVALGQIAAVRWNLGIGS